MTTLECVFHFVARLPSSNFRTRRSLELDVMPGRSACAWCSTSTGSEQHMRSVVREPRQRLTRGEKIVCELSPRRAHGASTSSVARPLVQACLGDCRHDPAVQLCCDKSKRRRPSARAGRRQGIPASHRACTLWYAWRGFPSLPLETPADSNAGSTALARPAAPARSPPRGAQRPFCSRRICAATNGQLELVLHVLPCRTCRTQARPRAEVLHHKLTAGAPARMQPIKVIVI